jgi:hypothetical protein
MKMENRTKLDAAFKDLKSAFAELKSLQDKILSNRARYKDTDRNSDAWYRLDREYNELQTEWDGAHRHFKAMLDQFNVLFITATNEWDRATPPR